MAVLRSATSNPAPSIYAVTSIAPPDRPFRQYTSTTASEREDRQARLGALVAI